MGAGVARPKQVHFDCDPDPVNLYANTGNRKVIKRPTSCHVSASTLVSENKLDLRKNYRLEITCRGGGVLRIGLTDTDPAVSRNILQGTIFEKEEGFNQEETTTVLYKEDFGYICFGPIGHEQEYPTERESTEFRLYLVFLYGTPEVKVQLIYADDKEYGVDISLSPLAVDQTSPSANTAVCRVREPIVSGDVYHCRWDMKLENEKIAEKSPIFGYMRLKLVSTSRDSECTVWERSSAVSEYPFSSVIAFGVSCGERTVSVSHNLFVTSVRRTGRDTFTATGPLYKLYLEIEFSCGEINIVHSKGGLVIRQNTGTILLVKDYISEDDDADTHDLLREIGSKVKYKPRRLMYGDNSVIFVLEFNKSLTIADKNKVGRDLGCQVEMLEDTDTVQINTDDSDIDEFDVENYFSRASAGNGEIARLTKCEEIPGSWMIQYRQKEVARRVWMSKTHVFTVRNIRVIALAFPMFEGLGLIVNNGEKPIYDRTPLTIDVDKTKLRFVMKRESEKRALVSKTNETIAVNIVWAEFNYPSDNEDGGCDFDEFESDFGDSNDSDTDDEKVYDDDDGVPNSITVECKVEETDGRKLAIWKSLAELSVKKYLKENIHEVVLPIENVNAEEMLQLLRSLQNEYDFEFNENNKTAEISLCGADAEMLRTLAPKLNIEVPVESEEIVTERVNIQFQQYLTLEAAGQLSGVKGSSSNTSFKIDRVKEIISLRGPADEVERGKRAVMRLAIDTRSIRIPLTEEQVEFLKRGGNNLLRDRLNKRKLNPNFILNEDHLDVMVYSGDGKVDKKERDILLELDILIKSTDVKVESESLEMLQTTEWESFKKEIETRAAGPLMISESLDSKIISIKGLRETVSFATQEIENYLRINGIGRRVIRVPIEVAEYLNEYASDEYTDNIECVKDSDGFFTGELAICAEMMALDSVKEAVETVLKQLKIHWFYIKKKWIASVAQNHIDFDTLSKNKRFHLHVEIGDSLAGQGIPRLALCKTRGAVIQLKLCDIRSETTNVIVNFTNGEERCFDIGLGVDDMEEINRQRNNANNVDDIILSQPGWLHCIKVMHVFYPTLTTGNQQNVKGLKYMVTKLLQTCQNEGFQSIAIPYIYYGKGDTSNDWIPKCIVEALAEFIETTGKASVKEVILCNDLKSTLDKFAKALDTLGKSWFVFDHGRNIIVDDLKSSSLRQAGVHFLSRQNTFLSRPNTPSNDLARPRTAQPGTSRPGTARPGTARLGTTRPRTPSRQNAAHDPQVMELKWGGHHGYGRNDHGDDGSSSSSSSNDRLPFHIPITDKLTLHIIKGDLTHQEVDVIVSTTTSFPDLKGAISRAVVEAGGETIRRECKSLDNLSVDKVIPTGPGHLPCKKIYHVHTPPRWNHKTGPDFIDLAVKTCLTTALSSSYSKVAFPMIGCGRKGFPTDKVANFMIKAICDVGKNFKSSPLTDVSIVVYTMAEGVSQVMERVVPYLFTTSDKRFGTRGIRQGGALARYVQPASFEKHSDADDVVIIKVVSMTAVQNIQKDIEQIVEEQFVETQHDYQQLSEEETLTADEESALKALALKYGVTVALDKKHVKISGLKKRVKECEIEAINLLQNEFFRWRLREIQVKAVSASVQWHYKDVDGTMHAVDPDTNFEIHIKYLEQKDFTYTNAREDRNYRVILNDMAEYPVNEPSKRRDLYMKAKVNQNIELPHNWSITENGDSSAEVKLNENEAEYNQIKDMLIKGGCPAKQIIAITRLENKFMWLQYQTKKTQLQHQNPQTQNERGLWHGTNIDTVPKIIKNGYDRSFAGNANMTAYGKGVYFAPNSSYSNRNEYAKADTNGVKRMIYNRVLTGVLCQGSSALATLPCRPGVTINNFPVCYDSAVDNVNTPAIFVIFHDTQVYPEYLIEYTA